MNKRLHKRTSLYGAGPTPMLPPIVGHPCNGRRITTAARHGGSGGNCGAIVGAMTRGTTTGAGVVSGRMRCTTTGAFAKR